MASQPRRIVSIAFATAFLWAGAGGAQNTAHFDRRLDLATGAAPGAVVVADFDGDGRPDIATGNFTARSVSILLSRPGHTFAPRADYPAEPGPLKLVAGDFDGDGFLDLVAASWPNDTVTLLLNDGAGHFPAAVPIAVADEPTALATGDWNEDGRLDLAITHYGPSQVGLLFGNGAGGFGGESIRPCGLQPNAIRAADLDADGHADLVLACSGSASLDVLIGAGTGVFADGGAPAVGSVPSDLDVADLDGDGIPDVVANNFGSGTLSVLRGLGGGAFGPRVDLPGGGYSVTAADVTGDGRLDLLSGRSTGTTFQLLCNDGSGSFPTSLALAAQQQPLVGAAGDLDGDGCADVVCVNHNSNSVTVTFGYRLAEFQAHREFVTGRSPTALALGDIDGDGHLDVATANWSGNSLTMLRGDGTGSLGSRSDLGLGFPLAVQIADVNGDGHADLLGSSGINGSIDAFTGDGTGYFSGAIVSEGGTTPVSLAVADLDGDPDPDLLVASSNRIQSSRGAGDGTFAVLDTHAATGPAQVAAARIDGDAWMDAAVVTPSAHLLEIFHGDGSGYLGLPQSLTVPGEPSGVAFADFTGDGQIDLALSMRWSSGATLGATTPTVFLVGSGFEAIEAGDLNGDGRPDVACANPGAGVVSVFHDVDPSIGTLADRVDLAVGPNAWTVALGDMNEDGAADLVATEFSSSTVNRVVVALAKRGTRTTLAATPAALHAGDALTLDADAATAGGGVADSGTVTFFDRGSPLATAPITAGHAHAVVPNALLPTGTIVAVYSGSSTLRSSVSDPAFVRMLHTGVTAVGPAATAPGLAILAANPTLGTHVAFTVSGGRAAPGRAEIFDASGRLVAGVPIAAGAGPRVVAIDLPAGSTSGIYFVRVRRGGAEATRRVTILR